MYTPVSFDAKVEEYLGSAMTITVASCAPEVVLAFLPAAVEEETRLGILRLDSFTSLPGRVLVGVVPIVAADLRQWTLIVETSGGVGYAMAEQLSAEGGAAVSFSITENSGPMFVWAEDGAFIAQFELNPGAQPCFHAAVLIQGVTGVQINWELLETAAFETVVSIPFPWWDPAS
jgi:Family of unknown function (DUF6461)